MTSFSPKEIFTRTQAGVADEIRAHREDGWLTIGLSFSLSEMAFNGASEAELHGARMLISTFQNIWEKKSGPTQLPRKTLDFDRPTESNQEPKK